MTLVEVLEIVKDHTGQDVIPETQLSTLGMDSLDFLDLLIRVGNIPDEVVPRINMVSDLHAAVTGAIHYNAVNDGDGKKYGYSASGQ